MVLTEERRARARLRAFTGRLRRVRWIRDLLQVADPALQVVAALVAIRSPRAEAGARREARPARGVLLAGAGERALRLFQVAVGVAGRRRRRTARVRASTGARGPSGADAAAGFAAAARG